MSYKLKVRESRSGSYNNPKFILTLQQTGSGEAQIVSNYEVIGKLVGGNDLLISLDTSLMSLPYRKREAYVSEFLNTVRSLGLEYRCNKVASSSNKSLIAGFLSVKDNQEQEILTFVPNEIWADSSFRKVLPIYGLRYFITRENADGSKILEDMQKMLDSEKLDYFKLIFFSSIYMNSIGVFTNSLTLSDIKNTLGIN